MCAFATGRRQRLREESGAVADNGDHRVANIGSRSSGWALSGPPGFRKDRWSAASLLRATSPGRLTSGPYLPCTFAIDVEHASYPELVAGISSSGTIQGSLSAASRHSTNAGCVKMALQ